MPPDRPNTMRDVREDEPDASVAELEAHLADALSQQAAMRLDLLKAEVTRDARALARELLPMIAGAAVLGFGYTLLTVGLALLLALWLGAGAGFVIMGAVNLLIGGLLVRRGGVNGDTRRAERAR